MNVLAHGWLAGGHAELEIGGVLGDFIRGRPDPAWSPGIRAGIVLHRAIDRFTDTHPQVVAARRHFEAPWRRYAGILLDIWFDHCLARDFDTLAAQPLDAFSQHLRDRLGAVEPALPERMRRFLRYMESHDLPAAYADPAMIERVFAGVSGRLSRANPMAAAMPLLRRQELELRAHFEAFWPDLAAFAADERERLMAAIA